MRKVEKVEPFAVPDWMESYRDLIGETGGNTVEELMNRLRNEPNLAATNIFVAGMALCVNAQIQLLHRLHAAGLLAERLPADFLCTYGDDELGEAAAELGRGPYRPTVRITYPTLNMTDGKLSQTQSPSLANTVSGCTMLNDEMVRIVRHRRGQYP